jgi:hypothetical protein
MELRSRRYALRNSLLAVSRDSDSVVARRILVNPAVNVVSRAHRHRDEQTNTHHFDEHTALLCIHSGANGREVCRCHRGCRVDGYVEAVCNFSSQRFAGLKSSNSHPRCLSLSMSLPVAPGTSFLSCTASPTTLRVKLESGAAHSVGKRGARK